MFGNRALYNDGWVAGCLHGRLPWMTGESASFDSDTWELYDIENDFSQAHDLAESEPEKLRELQDRFMEEAKKYNVLPLDDRFAERADANLRPNLLAGKKSFVYLPGTARVPEPCAPNTKNVDHTIGVELEIPAGGGDGVLVCCGGAAAGYSLFLHEGRLIWEHNWFNEERYRVQSNAPIPPGYHVLSAEVRLDGKGPGSGGEVTLRSGTEVIGTGRFERQVPFRFTVNETFDIGCDTVTPVSDLYESPATFNGKIRRVLVDITGEPFEDLAARAKVAMGMQ
jgi:hypothetical protein